MVARLAKRLGISMDHVYCAGDENNDLSMLAMAAEGFAPANCVKPYEAAALPLWRTATTIPLRRSSPFWTNGTEIRHMY